MDKSTRQKISLKYIIYVVMCCMLSILLVISIILYNKTVLLSQQYNDLASTYDALVETYDQYQTESAFIQDMLNEILANTTPSQDAELVPSINPALDIDTLCNLILELDGISNSAVESISQRQAEHTIHIYVTCYLDHMFNFVPTFHFDYDVNHGERISGDVLYDRATAQWQIFDWYVE